MDGHSADLVRLPLLSLYGGAWIDVGTILIRHLDDIWNVLQDPSNDYEFAAPTFPCRPDEDSVTNNFLMARKGNGLVARWHRIYQEVWGDAKESTGFHKRPLIRHLPLYNTY